MLSIEERIRQYEPFFGKWFLDDPPQILGRGNSGIVFLGHADDVDAALKIISIPRDQNQLDAMMAECGGSVERVKARIDQELEYAQSEIEIMERLKSDSHIVCFEESHIYTRTDTYGYDVIIRMERLVRLDAFLRAPEKYRILRGKGLILRIWSELVSGLAFCERCGIVHLDIKPENIFYAEPSRDYFKLGDFGVSIRSDNGRNVGAGMIVGTLDYMAPEIYQGQGGDIRSDIYSLALVIYALFNNDRLPFLPLTGRPTEADITAARKKRLEAGHEIPPIKGMDPTLSDILMRCLKRDPGDRYSSMAELYVDLEKYRLQKMDTGKKSGGKKKSVLVPVIIAVGALGVLGYLGVRMLPGAKAPKGEVRPRFSLPAGSNLISAGDLQEGRINYQVQLDSAANVSVSVNGRAVPNGTYRGDEHAPVSVVLDQGMLTQEGENVVELKIDDRVIYTETFQYDSMAALSLDGVNEGDILRTSDDFEGTAEPYATVRLLDRDGAVVVEKQASAEGRFKLNIEADKPGNAGPVSAGDYTLEVQDAAGNTARQSMSFILPSISVGTHSDDAQLTAEGGEIRVWGDKRIVSLMLYGEPGAAYKISNGKAIVYKGVFAEEGTDVLEMLFPEGERQYTMSYTDQSGESSELHVVADYTPPTLKIANEHQLKVYTEAAMVVGLDEDVTDVTLRDESGQVLFASDGPVAAGELTLGALEFTYQRYDIVARDAFGNEGTTSFYPKMNAVVDPLDMFSRQIVVRTVPEASVAVSVNGAKLDAVTADGDGVARVDVNDALWVGEKIKVVSTKGSARATLSMAVPGELVDYPIEIEECAYDSEAGHWTIRGTARPNMDLTASWEGVECGTAVSEADGSYVIVPSPDDAILPERGQDGTFVVRYTQGGEKDSQRVSLYWTGDMALSVEPLYAGSDSMIIRTDPNATVGIARGTADLGWFPANEEGMARWAPENWEFAAGDVYTVTATDSAGNVRTIEATVLEETRPAIADVTVNSLPAEEMGGCRVPASPLWVSGHAEPGAWVQIYWGDELMESVQANEEDGRFTKALSTGRLDASGETKSLHITYDDGGQPLKTPEFTWGAQSTVALSVEPPYHSGSLMVVNTAPQATVRVMRDGAYLGDKQANADGKAVWGLPEGEAFTLGEIYTVLALDGEGKMSVTEVDVVQDTRQPIADVTVDGLPADLLKGMALPRGALRVTGSAEPGAWMKVYWSDDVCEYVFAQDGRFAVEISADALDSAGESRSLQISYEDGGQAMETPKFTWGAESVLEVWTEPLYAGSSMMTVYSDPSVTVRVALNGEIISDIQTGDDGMARCAPDGWVFTLGQVYTLTAADSHGNVSVIDVEVVEDTRQPIVDVLVRSQPWNDLEDMILSRGPMKLSGSAEPGAWLKVYWSDEIGAYIRADENGHFSGELSGDALNPAGETRSLKICYEDGGQLLTTPEFTWGEDNDLTVRVFPLPYAGSYRITVSTAPGAHIRVNRGDTFLGDTVANDEGKAVWGLPEGEVFAEGQVYTVTAVDWISISEISVEVVADTRPQITDVKVNGVPADADGVSLPEGPMTVSGYAKPGTWLQVYWGSDYMASVQANESEGHFIGELNTETMGETRSLRICYEDGGQSMQTAPILWGVATRDGLSVDQVYPDSRMMFVKTLPNATVYISRDGVTVSQIPADENGSAVWILSDTEQFTAGEIYRLTGTDADGVVLNPVEVAVSAQARRSITDIMVDCLPIEKVRGYALTGGKLLITGSAEPGSMVKVYWSDRIWTVVQTFEDGCFFAELDGSRLDVTGERKHLAISYTDGKEIESSLFTWEREISLKVNPNRLGSNSDRFVVHTIPSATVYITRDGRLIATIQANDSGTAIWEPPQTWAFKGGELYTVIVVDSAMNVSLVDVTVGN